MRVVRCIHEVLETGVGVVEVEIRVVRIVAEGRAVAKRQVVHAVEQS